MLDGFQALNTPAPKSVKELQSIQHPLKLMLLGRVVLKEDKLVSRQVLLNSVAVRVSRLKLVKFDPNHENLQFPALGNGVLNEVSPLDRHASEKFTLFASVPSFASAGND